MHEVRLPHAIYYPDSHDVSLSDVAATLLAHERLLPVVTETLEILVPGLTVESRQIILDRIQKSSLTEAFFIALFVAFQEDLETEVPALIESITGLTVSDRYDTLVTVLFMVALYYGTTKLFRGGKRGGDTATPVTINGDYATYVGIAADQLQSTPSEVRAAVEKAVGRKRLASVQRAAIDLFRPAKRGGNGRILPRGLPPISAQSVADFPDALALADLEDDVVPVHLPRARLSIRATDRDKSDKGWAAKVETEDLKTRRLPLRLAPGIDPDALAEMNEPEVEAILESRVRDDGSTKPLRIHVMRVFLE